MQRAKQRTYGWQTLSASIERLLAVRCIAWLDVANARGQNAKRIGAGIVKPVLRENGCKGGRKSTTGQSECLKGLIRAMIVMMILDGFEDLSDLFIGAETLTRESGDIQRITGDACLPKSTHDRSIVRTLDNPNSVARGYIS